MIAAFMTSDREVAKFEEYDVVALVRSVPDVPVPVGTQGTILMVYDAEPPVYCVEFSDGTPYPVGGDVFDISHRDLELKIASKDMPDANSQSHTGKS